MRLLVLALLALLAVARAAGDLPDWSEETDYYDILGVERDAEGAVIKRACVAARAPRGL